MQIDKSQFPLVFLRDIEGPEVMAEVEFAEIFVESRAFVLIAKHDDHDDTHDSPDARKARALFLKQNKARLRKLCAAAIMIEGTNAIPMPLRLAAQGFSKAFGVPFHFVHDEAEATALGREILARDGG